MPNNIKRHLVQTRIRVTIKTINKYLDYTECTDYSTVQIKANIYLQSPNTSVKLLTAAEQQCIPLRITIRNHTLHWNGMHLKIETFSAVN